MPFGDTINAGLMNPDYSGIERAGAAKGAGYSAIGQGISNAMEAFGDYKKQQNEQKKVVKQADLYIDAAIKIFPELESSLQNARITIQDEDNPLSDRFAAAESIQGLLNMGFQGMKAKSDRMDALMNYEAQMAELRAKPPTIIEVAEQGGTQQRMWNPETGTLDEIGTLIPGLPEGDLSNQLPIDPVEGNGPAANQDPLGEFDANRIEEAAGLSGVNVSGGAGVLPLRPGFTPAKPVEQPDQFSETFFDEYGNQLQKNLTTGKISRVVGPPSGGIEIDTKTGKVIVGGPGGRQQQVAENAAAMQNQTAELGVIAISDTVNELGKMTQGGGPISTLTRVAGAQLPTGSPSRNFTLKVQALKDRIALGSLVELRNSSQTGGALGAVSNAEGQRLENKFGILTVEQTPEANKQVLRDIAITYAEIIHGTDKELAKALQEGKLTKEQVEEGKRLRYQMVEKAMSGKIKGLDDARSIGEPQQQTAPLVDPRIQQKLDLWNNPQR